MTQESGSDTPSTPPRPKARPTEVRKHEDVRIDEYAWLRDRDDPELLGHLKAENRHLEASMGHLTGLREELYTEMVARIKETDESVPYREHDHFYYYRTLEGAQYSIHCRKRAEANREIGPTEEVILDENELAKDQEFLHVGGMEVSPNGRFMVFAVDLNGDERFDVRVKDLETGELLPDRIEGGGDALAWSNDNATFYYTLLDATHRPHQIRRHRLGDAPSADPLVWQEDDERFFLSIERSKDERFLVADASSHTTTEQRLIDASAPEAPPRLVTARQQDVEYEVHPHGDRLFVLTNREARNFCLMETSLGANLGAEWRQVIAHRDDVLLTGMELFADHFVLFERKRGLPAIRVRKLSTGGEHEVTFDEPAYTIGDGDNFVFDTHVLRFEYSSLTTPRSIFDYDLESRDRTLLKQTEVGGGYDPSLYRTERIFAPTVDGLEVPISLVYRIGTPLDGTAPALLYGYGAYGLTMLPRFSSDRISLLDRGFVYAIAHIRGGAMLGRHWYETGKVTMKENTFRDFIASAEHLVAKRYTSADRLAISGGSAGGLLIGAVLNQRSELFGAAVAEVPFVDVLNTMLDDTLPLTVIEYEEWGNPNEPEAYHRIASYSPYDNVAAVRYPPILVTAGLNDPRVGYWEAAKWVARLRDRGIESDVLLKVHMGAGHQGASGRYDWLKDRALIFAFLIDRIGGKKPTP